MAQTIHIPSVLRDWRRSAGLTQAELAEAVQRTPLTIGRIERGYPCSVELVSTIARRCNGKVREGLTEEGLQKLDSLVAIALSSVA
jgi:transcriptional regulator with XRE-family HTH domain